jgi:hypothetical protein
MAIPAKTEYLRILGMARHNASPTTKAVVSWNIGTPGVRIGSDGLPLDGYTLRGHRVFARHWVGIGPTGFWLGHKASQGKGFQPIDFVEQRT